MTEPPFRRLPRIDDPDLLAARGDVAAAYLQGEVEAPTYSAGVRRTAGVETLPVRRRPDPNASMTTELLFGETFVAYAADPDGWTWGQADLDGYVGYVRSDGLVDGALVPTHRVAALRAHVFPRPDLKAPPIGALSLGSRVAVRAWADGYAEIRPGGWVSTVALGPPDPQAADYVAVAERLMGVPYLWGGRSSAGLDCSGLVQLALSESGVPAHRDSHVQEKSLGQPVECRQPGSFRRGDLVFLPGHVGMMWDDALLLHANATAMAVSVDPVELVAARVEATDGMGISSVRRLAGYGAGD